MSPGEQTSVRFLTLFNIQTRYRSWTNSLSGHGRLSVAIAELYAQKQKKTTNKKLQKVELHRPCTSVSFSHSRASSLTCSYSFCAYTTYQAYHLASSYFVMQVRNLLLIFRYCSSSAKFLVNIAAQKRLPNISAEPRVQTWLCLIATDKASAEAEKAESLSVWEIGAYLWTCSLEWKVFMLSIVVTRIYNIFYAKSSHLLCQKKSTW